MVMKPGEIVISYKQARNRNEQIIILSQLNGSHVFEICNILYDAGVLDTEKNIGRAYIVMLYTKCQAKAGTIADELKMTPQAVYDLRNKYKHDTDFICTKKLVNSNLKITETIQKSSESNKKDNQNQSINKATKAAEITDFDGNYAQHKNEDTCEKSKVVIPDKIRDKALYDRIKELEKIVLQKDYELTELRIYQKMFSRIFESDRYVHIEVNAK